MCWHAARHVGRKTDRGLWAVVSMMVGHLPSGPPPVIRPQPDRATPAARKTTAAGTPRRPGRNSVEDRSSCCDCLPSFDLHLEDRLRVGVIASDDLFAVVISSFDQDFFATLKGQ